MSRPVSPLKLEPPVRSWRDFDDWREFREERAAIGEHERGMTRAASEAAADDLAGPPPAPARQPRRRR